jgi:hypothetical protein
MGKSVGTDTYAYAKEGALLCAMLRQHPRKVLEFKVMGSSQLKSKELDMKHKSLLILVPVSKHPWARSNATSSGAIPGCCVH